LLKADAELVAAAISGDLEAFGDLVTRHEGAVRATAFGVSRDHHTAEDIAQDAFVHAFRKLATLRDGNAFGARVHRIARHEAVRPATRRRRLVPVHLAPEPRVSHAEVGLDRKAQELVEVARQLPEHERTVVMLRYFDGHAVKDIAEILGCPVGTVTMRLSGARARLREWLKENE
jgi:RNA polymerase sigma-70 factor (ECF subfamily)